jgi:hypothetical protein
MANFYRIEIRDQVDSVVVLSGTGIPGEDTINIDGTELRLEGALETLREPFYNILYRGLLEITKAVTTVDMVAQVILPVEKHVGVAVSPDTN